MSEPLKTAVDAVSIGTVIGTLAGWLPAIAAAFTIVWTGIRIYQSRTVQSMIGRPVAHPTRECVDTCPFFDHDDPKG